MLFKNFITTILCFCIGVSAFANETVNQNNKLIVIYKNNAFKERKTLSSKEATFEDVLNTAIGKVKGNIGENKLGVAKLRKEETAVVEQFFEKLDTYIVKINEEEIFEILKETLEEEPGIVKVTKDFEVYHPETNGSIIQAEDTNPSCTLSEALPNDPYIAENWHTAKTGLAQAWNDTCNCSSDISEDQCNINSHPEFCNVGSESTVIAVLDNGFSIGTQVGTTANPDLINRWNIPVSRNVIFGDNPLDYDSSDEPINEVVYDHGTAVALSAAANANNNISHAGVDWNTELWAVRIGRGGGASFSNILAGFDYVLQKVDEVGVNHFFINLSYSSGDCNKSLIEAVNNHAGQAVKNRGGLITIASGNNSCLQSFNDVGTDVIVVGATLSNDICSDPYVAGYSNYGQTTDIFSPSGFILDNRSNSQNQFTLSKQTIHGTSFSAPSLAGFGTFLWSINPLLTPDEIEKILKVSSFNSLSFFENNQTSKDRILASQTSQVKIDDAINFIPDILNTNITFLPSGEEQEVFAEKENNITVNAITPDLNIEIEAISLPENAIFSSTTLSWTPNINDIGNSSTVLFLVKNSLGKVIGFKRLTLNVVEKPENNPPTAIAGPDQTVNEGQIITLNGSQSFDPDDDELTFEWFQIMSGAPNVNLSNPNSPITSFTVNNVNGDTVFRFALRVKDTSNEESVDTTDITVKDINRSPLVDAGTGKIVRPKQVIKFTDATASDPEGDPLSYLWEAINPTVNLVRLNINQLNSAGFYVFGAAGNVNVTFKLTVSDGISNSSDTVTYTVTNNPPNADAGSDRTSSKGKFVGLGGTNNFDSDGDSISYSWSQVSGPSIPILRSNHPYPIIKIPDDYSTSEAVFRLTVSDGLGGIATDDISVFVSN